LEFESIAADVEVHLILEVDLVVDELHTAKLIITECVDGVVPLFTAGAAKRRF